MTGTTAHRVIPRRRLLFSCGQFDSPPRWYAELDDVLRLAGLEVCHAYTPPETIARIERGGLVGAVLVGDSREIDGLSLLRVIRSIDAAIPCWLVMEAASRHTLEAALALRAASVITRPQAADIRAAVCRVLN